MRRVRPFGLLLAFVVVLLCWLPARAAADVELDVDLSVAGARVLLDGLVVEASSGTALRLRAAPGAHELRIEKEGFEPWSQTITVTDQPLRIAALLLVANARARPALRVAMQHLVTAEGAGDRVSKVVADAVLSELRKLERVSAISMQEVGEMLSFEERRQLLGCDEGSCLAEISGALGVDELVSGSLHVLGDSSLFTLRRVDLKRASVVRGLTRRLRSTESGEEFLASVGGAIAELYAEYLLREGRSRGVSDAVVARLRPPPLPRWAFFTTLAVAGAGAVTGGFFSLAANDAHAQYRALLTREAAAHDVIEAQARVSSREFGAQVALGSAGVLVLVAAVEFFLTDWDAGDEELVARMSLAPAPGGLAVAWRLP